MVIYIVNIICCVGSGGGPNGLGAVYAHRNVARRAPRHRHRRRAVTNGATTAVCGGAPHTRSRHRTAVSSAAVSDVSNFLSYKNPPSPYGMA